MQLFIILSLVRICWLTFAAVNFSCSPSSLVFKCVCFCEGGVQPTPSFFCFCVSLQQNVNAQQKAVFPIAFRLDSAEKPDLLLCQNFHKDKARLNYAQMCPHFVCVCICVCPSFPFWALKKRENRMKDKQKQNRLQCINRLLADWSYN